MCMQLLLFSKLLQVDYKVTDEDFKNLLIS
jgi:hypothetical protein